MSFEKNADLDAPRDASRALTSLDTESDGSKGDDETEGIDLITLLQHVDLPLQTFADQTLPCPSASDIRPGAASADTSHAALLRLCIHFKDGLSPGLRISQRPRAENKASLLKVRTQQSPGWCDWHMSNIRDDVATVTQRPRRAWQTKGLVTCAHT